MRYYDLPKNKFDEFENNSKVFCAVWNIIPETKPNLHWHDYYTIDIISEGEAVNYSSAGKEDL